MIMSLTELLVEKNPEYARELEKMESLGLNNVTLDTPNSLVYEFKKAINIDEIESIEDNAFTFNGETHKVTTITLINGISLHAKADFDTILAIWSENTGKTIIKV